MIVQVQESFRGQSVRTGYSRNLLTLMLI